MKVHYKDYSTESEMPADLKNDKYSDKHGTLCGYMRKQATYKKEDVTCFFCKKELERRSKK